MGLGNLKYLDAPSSIGPGAAIFHAGPCVVYDVIAINVSGGERWLQLHNINGSPALGAVPRYTFLLQNKGTVSTALPGPTTDQGRRFILGCALVWSLTQDTYTPAPAASGPVWVAGRETA